MNQTIRLEIPEEEVPKLKNQLAQLVAKFKAVEEEHERSERQLVPLRAETDQILAATQRSLNNVERLLAATGLPFYDQR